jgi:hypothetical protein
VPGAGPDQRTALLVLEAHIARTGRPATERAPARPRFPVRAVVGAAVAAGAAGGGLAALGGAGAFALTGVTVAGAVLAAAVVTVVHLVRNRGPPRAAGTSTSPAAASGLAARRWTDRLVIGAPLVGDLATRRPVLGTLIGASLLAWPLTTAGVPGAGVLAVGATVVAVAVVLAPRMLHGLHRLDLPRIALPAGAPRIRAARARAGEVARGFRAGPVTGMRRWVADRTLRSVVAGLERQIRAGQVALAGARAELAAADARLVDRQRAAVRWLYGGPDAWSVEPGVDAARVAAVARLLGLDPAEVRRYALDRTVAVDALGLGAPTGSFADRLARVAAEFPAVVSALRAVADGVHRADAELARRHAERRPRLEAAVRAAAGAGVPVRRIAAITGLSPEQVRAIVDGGSDGGPGPSASGGGPPTGGGTPNPSGNAPERSATPPAGTTGTAGMRTAGPRAGGPRARSRGPPRWKRLFSARTLRAALALGAGIAVAVAAYRLGAGEALGAAGVFWWPGQRRAADELRTRVEQAREALAGVERAEEGALGAVRGREHELGTRTDWVPALADRLRRAGWNDDRIVADLAAALALHPERVRARLADPVLAASDALPAELAGSGVSAEELIAGVRAAVAARSAQLDSALMRHERAARGTADARAEAQQRSSTPRWMRATRASGSAPCAA